MDFVEFLRFHKIRQNVAARPHSSVNRKLQAPEKPKIVPNKIDLSSELPVYRQSWTTSAQEEITTGEKTFRALPKSELKENSASQKSALR